LPPTYDSSSRPENNAAEEVHAEEADAEEVELDDVLPGYEDATRSDT